MNYLIATGKPIDMILNFGERKIEIRRKVKDINKEINRMKNHVNPVHPVKKVSQFPPSIARITANPSFSIAEATVSWSSFPGVRATI